MRFFKSCHIGIESRRILNTWVSFLARAVLFYKTVWLLWICIPILEMVLAFPRQVESRPLKPPAFETLRAGGIMEEASVE